MSAYFVIKKTVNNQFMFNFKGGNNETVLTSETYLSKESAENGIKSVKVNAPDATRYRKMTDTQGEYRFTLLAANNKAIGVSEGYTTESNRDKGIECVKTKAPDAPTKDLTE